MGTGTKKVPEPGIFHISGGIGTGIGNISVPEKSLCTKTSISVAKTLEFRRLMINFSFFLVVSEPISEKNAPGKSLGTGIGKFWYWKKISGLVLETFVTEKSIGIGIGNIWYLKKYWYRHRLKFSVPSHTGIGIPCQQFCGVFEGGRQRFLPAQQRSGTTLWQASIRGLVSHFPLFSPLVPPRSDAGARL